MLSTERIPEVLNARVHGRSRSGAVYIGRPGPWGNPFSIGKHGTREEVIAKYIAWLHDHPDFVARVRKDLRGKDLICWCAPLACHGHILRDLALGRPLPEMTRPSQPRLL
ncbi:DUF4326 domain-containing protein [Leisingera sp. XS_AS12]|uniref:DUF4326 domain-containing protein n=1 Tax=Leisingera sp. XS_AS12 TaxID=3241294 RepID=UPI0035129198